MFHQLSFYNKDRTSKKNNNMGTLIKGIRKWLRNSRNLKNKSETFNRYLTMYTTLAGRSLIRSQTFLSRL